MHKALTLALLGSATACSTTAIPTDDSSRIAKPSGNTWQVCPANATDSDCHYVGNGAIQAAVDAAVSGDTIRLRAGTYVPESYRDVTYGDLIVRGYVVVEDKTIHFEGESGAVLQGSPTLKTSAFVVNSGAATFSKLTLERFTYMEAEDNIYDGHGIFLIDANADIRDVTMLEIQKMGLSIREDSHVTANNIRFIDGHMGVWIEEEATLRINASLFRNNDSAGVGAYNKSSVTILNSVFDRNQDDGIYAAENAVIHVDNTVVMYNVPYGIRSVDNGQISLNQSFVYGNEKSIYPLSQEEALHSNQRFVFTTLPDDARSE